MASAIPLAPRRQIRQAARKSGAVLAVLTLAAGMLLAGPARAPAAPSDRDRDKIGPELRAELAAGGETDLWVRFADRADLARARQIEDWTARGEAVAGALRATARASQAAVRAALAAQGVDHRAFWATNAIYLPNAGAGLAEQLAARPEVDRLLAPTEYQLIEPEPAESAPAAQLDEVEWGIANIRADAVWDQLGVRGEGITVANLDSGVEFDHPALVEQYRGNLGDGQFDHNYHWFDFSGICGGEPCDRNAHGTHVMGTMVGDGGPDARIGVAPRARWIAANGCCPSEQALIASGQWLLEPTDLTGANPDAGKRPHVVNNSWGSVDPSTDPFMEDVLLAWEASGILAIWANGNSGELGCASSGAPGSRTIAYSVGAYAETNQIAEFSGRGPGQDGELKPNLAAPGVSVRSALRGGDGYVRFSGTSMAAPHVAGAVALLWSAAPELIGDTAATTALLDQTAIDTEDLQCGGTAADNHVYGEGRLNALALLQGAPIGDNGTVAGTVTDAATGDPVPGATVEVRGELTRELRTGPDGRYAARMPAGDYQLTGSAFGYAEASAPVRVTAGATTTRDLTLDPLPMVTVSGVVRDGSGQGWPLYARLGVPGIPQTTTYSDPFTGEYQLSLPADHSFPLLVQPQHPGYQELTDTLPLGSSDLVRDLAATVDLERCTAPGYAVTQGGFVEDFDQRALPPGWTVVDNQGTGQVWRFDDPGLRGNLTGGEHGFAIIDSGFFGFLNRQDTALVSPVIDLSGTADPVLRFQQDFLWRSNNQDEFAAVDLSLDGGASWENLLQQAGGSVRGPDTETIAIPQAAGEPDVRVRFHYGNARQEWWWQVDDVLVGTVTGCEPQDGGLVAGFVQDQNTGAAVYGATVASAALPSGAGHTRATPDDPQVADGLYRAFAPAGEQPVTASAPHYASQTEPAGVLADQLVRQDYSLAAGRLVVDPDSVTAQVRRGQTAGRQVTFTNAGTAPVELELAERGGTREPSGPGGGQLATTPAGPPDPAIGPPATARGVQPAAEPWLDLPALPQTVWAHGTARVGDAIYTFGGRVAGNLSASVFGFDLATQAWTQLGDLPAQPRYLPAAGAIDGLAYLVGGQDGDRRALTDTLIYHPVSDGWSTGADLPAGRYSAGRAVLDGQLYVVGGCTDALCPPVSDDVFRYDPGTDSWQQLADYPVPTADMSCGGIDGRLYCAGGLTGTLDVPIAVRTTYEYDPATDTWQERAPMPSGLDLWAAAYTAANNQLVIVGGVDGNTTLPTNEAVAYRPATDTWQELPPANEPERWSGAACGFYRVGGIGFRPDDSVEQLPGFDRCEPDADVSWLSVSPTTLTIAPGQSVVVTVSLDASAPVGTHTAAVPIRADTPYPVPPIEVTMTVTRR